MAKARTRDELDTEWWQGWWAADYSWKGLRGWNKNIAGNGGLHGARTLQDYWRIDLATGIPRTDAEMDAAGELERAPDGKLWHIAHVPLVWPDGNAAKSGWSDEKRAHLAAIVAARIASAQETTVGRRFYEGAVVRSIDGRAQLQGSILLDRPDRPADVEMLIHIAARRCRLPAWDASGLRFGCGASFDSAIFSGHALFDHASFLGDASFESAIFSGHGNFDRANFSGDARFDNAAFSRNTRFESATFSGDTRFNSATFSGDVRFYGATFLGRASFKSATFINFASFRSATFSRATDFDNATFESLSSFESVTVLGSAGFSGATFLDEAFFGKATFSGYASFQRANFLRSARFDSVTFAGFSSFESTTFAGLASFESATFSGRTSFTSAIFTGEALFDSARFLSLACFVSANFEKSGSFRKAEFELKADNTTKSGQMQFGKAVFSGPIDFEGAVFSANPSHHLAAFLGARFADLVSFRGCGDHWVAALDEAEIKGRILIDERDEAAALHDFDTLVLPRARDGGENPATKELLLRELEGGCRTIKVAMGAARNEIMEQRYYRFQLLARREQAGVPRSERLMSYLFGWAADYGLSLTRPLHGLGLLMLVFTIIYTFFWHATGVFGSAGLIKSIEMAASRMFPFGAFEDSSKNWFIELGSRGAYPYTLLFARLFASVQSLIALILIFLFGLAVRRRFKVGE